MTVQVIPVTGGISRHPKLRIAKFTQHHLEMFDMENDAVAHMRNLQVRDRGRQRQREEKREGEEEGNGHQQRRRFGAHVWWAGRLR